MRDLHHARAIYEAATRRVGLSRKARDGQTRALERTQRKALLNLLKIEIQYKGAA